MQKNKRILDEVRKAAYRPLTDILKDLDPELVRGALGGEHFRSISLRTVSVRRLQGKFGRFWSLFEKAGVAFGRQICRLKATPAFFEIVYALFERSFVRFQKKSLIFDSLTLTEI